MQRLRQRGLICNTWPGFQRQVQLVSLPWDFPPGWNARLDSKKYIHCSVIKQGSRVLGAWVLCDRRLGHIDFLAVNRLKCTICFAVIPLDLFLVSFSPLQVLTTLFSFSLLFLFFFLTDVNQYLLFFPPCARLDSFHLHTIICSMKVKSKPSFWSVLSTFTMIKNLQS